MSSSDLFHCVLWQEENILFWCDVDHFENEADGYEVDCDESAADRKKQAISIVDK
jgi:hypothetical protein